MSSSRLPSSIVDIVDRVFRTEARAILASLIRASGDFQLAEDSIQDAFAEALRDWPERGVPEEPGGWVLTTARRRACDRLRQKRRQPSPLAPFDPVIEAEKSLGEDFVSSENDGVRLFFTCCHPALGEEVQVALALRVLGGLSTVEIARAFLVPPKAMAQRLVRAKKALAQTGVPFETPEGDELIRRVPTVLSALYLLFNEGYAATAGDSVIDRERCEEALQYGTRLVEFIPSAPEAFGLLSLMEFHHSRRDSREGEGGLPIRLEDQDRRLWDREAIDRGRRLLRRAKEFGAPGIYQIQALIAAVHSQASTPEETDWRRILRLYDALYALQPNGMVALNRAVASGMVRGWEVAFTEVESLSGSMENYPFYHSTRAEILTRLSRFDEARSSFSQAAALSANETQRLFWRERQSILEGK